MSSIGVLKVPLNSPSQPKDDLRSRRILLKRQQLQEEFTKRILDPKIRTIGIDKQALDAQVKEKQIVTQMEKDRDAYFERQMVDMDAHAQYLQRESDHLRHKREVDLNKYRECFQRKEHCREWDLQDPKRILNELPARIRDDDIRCGPSSIQKFEGEDLDAKCRRRAQNLQQQHWAEEQVSERRMRDLIHKEYDVAMDRCAEEMANRAFEIQNVVAQQRRAAAITTTNFNLALAKQKEDEKKRQKLQETISSIEEVQNMLDSDFLAETQGIREKGLSETDKQYIHREQQRQREEVYQRKLREAEERKQEDLRLEMERRMAVALDRQRERERKAALMQLAEERKEQARNKLEADKNLKMTYTPTVTEGFFDRFGLGRKF